MNATILLRYLFGCVVIGVAIITPGSIRGATFQNLGFEDVVLPLVPIPGDVYGRVPISAALPGWQGHIATTVEDRILHDTFFLGSSGFAIHGPPNGSILEGNYTAWLMAGVALFGGPADATLSQVGTIPADANSLRFRAALAGPPVNPFPLRVALGGQMQPLFLLGTDATSPVYGVDVSAFQGSDLELAFTLKSGVGMIPGINFLALDSIQFSTQPIPEPGTSTLLVLGGGLLVLRRWRRKRGP